MAGVWLVSTAFVLVNAALGVARPAPMRTTNDRVLVYLALLHLAFVLLFFGNSFSYRYYFYLLVMAVSLCPITRPGRRWVTVALTVWLGVLVLRHLAVSRVQWRLRLVSPVTAGLYAEQGYREGWQAVLEKTPAGNTVLLAPRKGRPC